MSLPTKDRSPLLPDRHPTADFFVCDIFDAAPKSDMASMEHPIFSLSTKPDHHVRRYEHGDTYVEIKPSSDGLATVHDRDILIYCISQVMSALNEEREVSQVIRFKAYDLLKATNRMTNGRGYSGLKAALDRLAGTRISTNIATGGQEVYDNFGLIDRATIIRETRDGRMQDVEIRLSDWVFNAVIHKEVLTLHRDYFRLRKPIERRIYDLARKHCGRQPQWIVTLATLQKKCGATSPAWEFRRMIAEIIKEDEQYSHMPDYAVRFVDDDKVLFQNRNTNLRLTAPMPTEFAFRLSGDGYELAKIAAPGWDVHYLEREWRAWITEAPRDADAAFVGFCRKWFEIRGRPS